MADPDIIAQLETQIQEEKAKTSQLANALSQSAYDNSRDKNSIESQIDNSEMLAKIEHFLKGEVLEVDAEGNEYWAKQTNKELVLFNEYGVNSIMSIIGNYIDKNTILSNYNLERINNILADLGEELVVFILCNYEKMGMDTNFKKSRYGLTVVTIIHAIESAYRRALFGKTSEDINSSRIFTQSDIFNPNKMGSPQNRNSFNMFKPSTWFK